VFIAIKNLHNFKHKNQTKDLSQLLNMSAQTQQIKGQNSGQEIVTDKNNVKGSARDKKDNPAVKED
jgi:hypothetical protein